MQNYMSPINLLYCITTTPSTQQTWIHICKLMFQGKHLLPFLSSGANNRGQHRERGQMTVKARIKLGVSCPHSHATR